MQQISNIFLVNLLKQDVLYINQKNKILQINPIFFLMNLKQTLRLKQFNLPVGVYIKNKQCRDIIQHFLSNTNLVFLSDDNFFVFKNNVSLIFFIQTQNFSDQNSFKNLNFRNNFIININQQVNTHKVSCPFYSILIDNFKIKNIFFLITFFRFFIKTNLL